MIRKERRLGVFDLAEVRYSAGLKVSLKLVRACVDKQRKKTGRKVVQRRTVDTGVLQQRVDFGDAK